MRKHIVRYLVTFAMILCCGTPAFAAPPAAEPRVATGTLSAVVRTSDPATVHLDILTGRGFSLRILTCVATSGTTSVKGMEGIAGPVDLRPGSILRVRYRQEKESNVALTIEIVPKEVES